MTIKELVSFYGFTFERTYRTGYKKIVGNQEYFLNTYESDTLSGGFCVRVRHLEGGRSIALDFLNSDLNKLSDFCNLLNN